MAPKSAKKEKNDKNEKKGRKVAVATTPMKKAPIENSSSLDTATKLNIRNILIAAALTVLAAIYSPVSQASLSPVYGSVPSSLYHHHGAMAFAMVAFSARFKFPEYFPRDLSRYLPAFVFWIPTMQYVLFQASGFLGNPLGPFLTELLTYFPLVGLSAIGAATYINKVNLYGYGEAVAENSPAIVFYFLFVFTKRLATRLVGMKIGTNFLMSRIGLQLSVASLYALVLPSALLWPAVPSIAFNLGFNIHTQLPHTTSMLNNTLAAHNITLLDRKDSLTGYISVVESADRHYRVMRCDHSLLGGQWLGHTSTKSPSVAEPIYAIFAMLEAVRLVETDDRSPRRPDAESTALTIGLGIGTTPGAFIMHGISTTIVEIDPVVYEFAKEYFDLPSNHTPVVADAVKFVSDTRKAGVTYDYVVHDVFTGGAEPVNLFTLEFLQGLHALLKEDGVIAINYAGDLATPSARIIIHTIRAVFPACRVFRENSGPEDEKSDFTNMVIFCKKNKNTPLTFRQPVEADYLHSRARQAYLYPVFELGEDQITVPADEVEKLILREGQTKQLEKLHLKSAVGHWALMRNVLPTEAWINW